MSKIYKYFFIVFFLSFSSNIFAWTENTVVTANLRNRLVNDIQNTIQGSSLYTFVKQELSDYYGLQDFSDSKHETGWYRVDDFLKWVKKNEETLQNATVNIADTSYELKNLYLENNYSQDVYRNIFWVYLGARYIISVYNVIPNLKVLRIYNACEKTSSLPILGEIYLCIEPDATIPYLINIGIHETTHLLPRLDTVSRQSKGPLMISLSEFATFYSTRNYGLPVKSEDALGGKDGVRDVLRTMTLRPEVDILKEYNAYLAGPLITNITKKDVLSLYGDSLSSQKIMEFCFNCAAINENKFFIINSFRYRALLSDFDKEELSLLIENKNKEVYLGKKESNQHTFAKWFEGSESVNIDFFAPITMSNYTKKIFGKYANVKINEFYGRLCDKLPKDFIDEVKGTFEVQTNNTYITYNGEDIVRKYEEQIRNAIIQTLKEMNVSEAKIPEGYI